MIAHLNTLGGNHGVGRVDHVENRLVGIKSREIYECPAAVILHAAHKALETMTLSREQARTKARIAQEYSDVVYNGLWYTAHRADLDAYVQKHPAPRHRRGAGAAAQGKLHCGRTAAPRALYNYGLATYDRQDQFDHTAAAGFIGIYGLPVRTQNQAQPDKPNQTIPITPLTGKPNGPRTFNRKRLRRTGRGIAGRICAIPVPEGRELTGIRARPCS